MIFVDDGKVIVVDDGAVEFAHREAVLAPVTRYPDCSGMFVDGRPTKSFEVCARSGFFLSPF